MLTAATFLAVYFGCAALALTRNPIYGLYLYLGVFYIHPPSRWWSYVVPDLRWSLLSAAIAILALFIHRKKLPPSDRPWYSSVPGIALILFVIWLWIQNLWALDAPTHYNGTVQFTKYLIAYYLVYRLATNVGDSVNILMLHVAGCFFLGVLCFFSGRNLGARLDGVGGPGIDDANSLGMFLATGVAVGAVLILTQTGWRRMAVIVALPFILNGLVLSGSRGAFLGLLAGGAVIFMLRPPQRRWMFWSAAVLGAVLAVKLVDDQFIDRMFTIKEAVKTEGEIDSSAESRLVLVEAQLKMAAAYPHGTGHRGTATLSPKYLDRQWLTRTPGQEDEAQRSSHNTFLSVLVEQGVPGAIVYFWLCFWGVKVMATLKGLQWRRAPIELSGPAIACCAGIAVVWTAGHFTDYLLAEVQIWLFALLAASMEHIRQASQVSRTQSGPAPSHRPFSARQAT